MKLATFRLGGSREDRIGAVLGDQVLEFTCPKGQPEWNSMLALIEHGPTAWEKARTKVRLRQGSLHALSTVRLRAPIPLPPQYRDAMCFHQHIRQSFTAGPIIRAKISGDKAAVQLAELAAVNYEIPSIHLRQPVYYKGNRFAIGHPDQVITWPKYSKLMDFELELACIVGKRGKDLTKQSANDHIFGYMILNDLTARDAQGVEMEGKLGPAKGKDFDNANVFGPWIVTADEISDPYDLAMTARVNGDTWSTGSSADMYWTFEDLLSHISMGETIYPGEIIGSGTVGNGSGLENHRFLLDGDFIELEINQIGILKNQIVR